MCGDRFSFNHGDLIAHLVPLFYPRELARDIYHQDTLSWKSRLISANVPYPTVNIVAFNEVLP